MLSFEWQELEVLCDRLGELRRRAAPTIADVERAEAAPEHAEAVDA